MAEYDVLGRYAEIAGDPNGNPAISPALRIVAEAPPKALNEFLEDFSPTAFDDYLNVVDARQRVGMWASSVEHRKTLHAQASEQNLTLADEGKKILDKATKQYDAACVEADAAIAANDRLQADVAPVVQAIEKQRHQLDCYKTLRAGVAVLAFAMTGAAVQWGLSTLQSEGASVSSDASILPGGSHEVVPGLSDIYGETLTYHYDDGQLIFGETVNSTQQKTSNSNPLAPDFQLTGSEVSRDAAALMPILEYAQKHDSTIISVDIKGEASDENRKSPGAGLGAAEPEQLQLAKARAQAGKQALQQGADKLGLHVGTVHEAAQEHVLTSSQIKIIDGLAETHGVSRLELIENYDNNVGQSSDVTAVLDGSLANNRSVSYQITMKEPQSTETYQSQPKTEKVSFMGVPGEAIAGFLGLVVGAMASVGLPEVASRRVARWRARRAIR